MNHLKVLFEMVHALNIPTVMLFDFSHAEISLELSMR